MRSLKPAIRMPSKSMILAMLLWAVIVVAMVWGNRAQAFTVLCCIDGVNPFDCDTTEDCEQMHQVLCDESRETQKIFSGATFPWSCTDVEITVVDLPHSIVCPYEPPIERLDRNSDGTYTRRLVEMNNLRTCMIDERRHIEIWTDYPDQGGYCIKHCESGQSNIKLTW